ncbi:TPA: hypothetical protein DCX16_04935 [bacterium]|nr:hypothetical protein [bacterium]
MVNLKSEIIINKSLDEVFQVVIDVERWGEFLPTHKNMKILSSEDNRILIEWRMSGLRLKTIITIDRTNKKMTTEQVSGLVKGLKAEYIFEEEENKTRLSLVHQFKSTTPIIGRLIELIVIKSLRKLRQNTLNRIRERVER